MTLKAIYLVILITIQLLSQPNIEWEKTFSRSNTISWGKSVIQTNDSGYIIAGNIQTTQVDIFIIKTNRFGDTLWTKTFGGNGNEICSQVIQTTDGGYAIVGYTNSFGNGNDDFMLLKINQIGDLNWVKTYGDTSTEFANSVTQTSDGGYILCGSTKSYGNGNYHIMVVKVNQVGEKEWTKYYGNGNLDFGRSIKQIENDEYIILGATDSFGSGNIDIILMKVNTLGNLVWSTTYDFSANDSPFSLQQTYDNGFIIAGQTITGPGQSDILLVKTNNDGTKEWNKIYGGDKRDGASEVKVTPDSGFIICGNTNEIGNSDDGLVIKTNKDGDIVWTKNFSELSSFPHPLSSICTTFDNGYIATGSSPTTPFGFNVWLVKLGTDTTLVNVNDKSEDYPLTSILEQNYPNPFNPRTTIKYSVLQSGNIIINIFNSVGEKIKTLLNDYQSSGDYSIYWNGLDDFGYSVTSGVYYYQMISDKHISSKKMILLK